MRQERKKRYYRASREVWYIGPRCDTPQRVATFQFKYPDQYPCDGHTFVYTCTGGFRWFECAWTDLEIRSEGKRYPYMLYPAGGC